MATPTDLSSLIPIELMAQLAAQSGAAHGPYKPKTLPDTFALDNQLNQQIMAESHGTSRPAPAAVTNDVNGMLAEFHDKTDALVPNARYKGGDAHVYISPDPTINMASLTHYDSADGKTLTESAYAITISAGTLNPPDPKLRLTHDELKALVAHEYAHNLIQLNPELLDDKRFQPHGKQFEKELNALEDRLDRSNLTNEQKQQKVDDFYKEAVADNIALRLTKDVGAAQRAQDKSDKSFDEATHGRPVPGVEDVPSPAARTENRQIAAHEMEAAAKRPVQKQGQSH